MHWNVAPPWSEHLSLALPAPRRRAANESRTVFAPPLAAVGLVAATTFPVNFTVLADASAGAGTSRTIAAAAAAPLQLGHRLALIA